MLFQARVQSPNDINASDLNNNDQVVGDDFLTGNFLHLMCIFVK